MSNYLIQQTRLPTVQKTDYGIMILFSSFLLHFLYVRKCRESVCCVCAVCGRDTERCRLKIHQKNTNTNLFDVWVLRGFTTRKWKMFGELVFDTQVFCRFHAVRCVVGTLRTTKWIKLNVTNLGEILIDKATFCSQLNWRRRQLQHSVIDDRLFWTDMATLLPGFDKNENRENWFWGTNEWWTLLINY